VFEPPGALRLRHLTGPQRGTIVVLRPPRSRIGRSRSNDIIIADRDGAAASAHHAEAVRTRGQWWIHDLESRNGTRLNGTPVTRAPIAPGDRLQFGDIECEVVRGRFFPTLAFVALIALVTSAAVLVTRGVPPNFESVAARVSRSVFLVGIDTATNREIIGTAFVVADGLLATNAHVAARVQVPSPDRTPVVVRGDGGQPHRITTVHLNAEWREGSIAGDVALLRVAGLPRDAAPLALAGGATLQALTRGTSIATFGFPAMSTDARRPRGRLSTDALGDVRDRYLAVGLRVAPGMSGSPIFLRDGVVVGLVVGGDFRETPTGEKLPTGSDANWGISVVPLQQLLRECAAKPPH
jgi:hypothetical protein